MGLEKSAFALTSVVAMLLAGCAGSAGGSTEAEATPEASATTETGAIDGSVVDDEQIPVVGANVVARHVTSAFQAQATTANDGSYSISELAPGPYVLYASAFAYEANEQRVDVVAGEITEVTSVLPRIRIVEPMPELTTLRGFINCSTSTPANGGGFYSYNFCREYPSEASQFPITIDPVRNATEVIVELVWQASGPVGLGERLQLWFCSFKMQETNYMNCIQYVGQNPYAERTEGTSPVVMRLTDVPFQEISEYEVDVGDGAFETASPRVPLTFQQSFDVYLTVCYLALCPADYTAQPPA